ncbi:MAG: hypothetical protein IIY21_18270 [Clostridiales bacterium]|nr:hypothetical protein [Clostridiales bacterium]
MESYELNKAINENETVVLTSAMGEICIEKMQEQWEMRAMGGAILILFDTVFCESYKNMELIFEKECVASFDPTEFEVA